MTASRLCNGGRRGELACGKLATVVCLSQDRLVHWYSCTDEKHLEGAATTTPIGQWLGDIKPGTVYDRAPLTPDQIAIAQSLRRSLEKSTDDELDVFLAAFAAGTVAGMLVEHMTPGGRAGFFGAMRVKYPELFAPPAAPPVPSPLVDGVYWLDFGGPTIAERTTEPSGRVLWNLVGSDDYYVGDDRVVIIAGPLTPPEAPT